MAKRAGKLKPFTIPQAAWVLLVILLFEASSAFAATPVDLPVFRLANRFLAPAIPPLQASRLPRPEAMLSSDRVAVETILLEAAGDGFSSMVAVGETIRNRTQLFKKGVSEVCLQPKQFSGWNDRDRAERFLKDHRRFYGRAWLAWKFSAATALTSGATDYHTEDILPYWADAYTESARVGSHIFYIRQARRMRE